MPRFERIAGALEQFRLVNDREPCARCREPLLDFNLRNLWTEVGSLNSIQGPIRPARPTKMLVKTGECCTERPTCITRCGLNPYALKGTIAQNLAIGDAIERDATG